MLTTYSRGVKNKKGDLPYLDRFYCGRQNGEFDSGKISETRSIVVCDGVSGSFEDPTRLVGYTTRMLAKGMSGRFFDLFGRKLTSKRLARLIEKTNDDVFDKLKNGQLPFAATTALVCYDCGDYISYSWVGNTRLYRVRGSIAEQLTQDHTRPDGGPSKAIGGPPIKADKGYIDMCESDIFLACTDGLFEKLQKEDIAKAFSENNQIETATERLIEEAVKKGTLDDITAVSFKKC